MIRGSSGWRIACAGLVAAVAGCGHDAPHTPARSNASTPAASRNAPLSPADSAALARDAWTVPEVIKRLSEAGLVVTDSGRTISSSQYRVPGHVLHLGDGGHVVVYLYAGRSARSRDLVHIDTVHHGLPTLDMPHYVVSGNLIAILTTPRDETVERVTNALLARHTVGPP